MLSVVGASDDVELGLLEETFATLLRNHSGPNLIDSVIVSSKKGRKQQLSISNAKSLRNSSPRTHLMQFLMIFFTAG